MSQRRSTHVARLLLVIATLVTQYVDAATLTDLFTPYAKNSKPLEDAFTTKVAGVGTILNLSGRSLTAFNFTTFNDYFGSIVLNGIDVSHNSCQ